MTSIALWLLIVAGDSRGGALVVDRFTSRDDCLSAVAQIERQSAEKRGMYWLYGICIEAKVYKP